MKKRVSFSRLMHNDKLMMLASLFLAILVWAVVVYGPGNSEEQVITGVPVSITLSEYASQNLNLRIVSGGDSTATVKVYGLRSVISRLSAADITVTADTGSVLAPGTYTLPLKAVANGDYAIQSVVGDDGVGDTVTATFDVWREMEFVVEAEMPNLVLADEKAYQFGTPQFDSEAVKNGMITVSGPKTAISSIATVVAAVDEAAVVSETDVYEARLEARDAQGNVVQGISFKNLAEGRVNVTLPVMVYRQIDLQPSMLHIPAAYAQRSGLITVNPTSVELWGVPGELEEYIASVNELIQWDFDQLNPGRLTQNITLETVDGIRPVNGSETVQVKVNLTGIGSRIIEGSLSEGSLSVANCPEGYAVSLKQNKLAGITICGPTRSINSIKPEDIRLTVDMGGSATVGQQTVKARIEVAGRDDVWVYYGENSHSVDVLISVEQPVTQ